jgi:hypothetical protein
VRHWDIDPILFGHEQFYTGEMTLCKSFLSAVFFKSCNS